MSDERKETSIFTYFPVKNCIIMLVYDIWILKREQVPSDGKPFMEKYRNTETTEDRVERIVPRSRTDECDISARDI